MTRATKTFDELSTDEKAAAIHQLRAERNGAPRTQREEKKKTSKRASERRFELLNWFIDKAMRECSVPQRLVWIVLYRHTRKKTVSVSQRFIALQAGLSRRSVHTAVCGLVEKGLLVVVTPGQKNRAPATYRLADRPK